MDLLNIQKTLFREFSSLLNYDIENQIRKNTDALSSISTEGYDTNDIQKEGEIDNLLYKFYQSLTKMFSGQPEVKEIDKRMDEKFDLSNLHYASIFTERPNTRRREKF
ncbi:MAG: hypothetical protein LWX07_12295 [Bacteroidetes bacterium]|nr:hypothetical protein [Bacteroidota bacterium]